MGKLHNKVAARYKIGKNGAQDPFKRHKKKLGGKKDTKGNTDHIATTTTVRRVKVLKQVQFSPFTGEYTTSKGRPLEQVLKQLSHNTKNSHTNGVKGMCDIFTKYGPNLKGYYLRIMSSILTILARGVKDVRELVQDEFLPIVYKMHPVDLHLGICRPLFRGYMSGLEFGVDVDKEIDFLNNFCGACPDLLCDRNCKSNIHKAFNLNTDIDKTFSSLGNLVIYNFISKAEQLGCDHISRYVSKDLIEQISQQMDINILADVSSACLKTMETNAATQMRKATKTMSLLSKFAINRFAGMKFTGPDTFIADIDTKIENQKSQAPPTYPLKDRICYASPLYIPEDFFDMSKIWSNPNEKGYDATKTRFELLQMAKLDQALSLVIKTCLVMLQYYEPDDDVYTISLTCIFDILYTFHILMKSANLAITPEIIQKYLETVEPNLIEKMKKCIYLVNENCTSKTVRGIIMLLEELEK